MKQFFGGLVCCALACASGLPAQTAHQHHPPESPAEYARVLEDPGRDAWQKPHDVVMALHLKATDTVADIGAGSCYFARRFAHHAGLVYAVDIDKGLLDICQKDAPPNLKTALSVPDDPKLPQDGVDVVFFCDVLHHIDHRAAYLQKVKRSLKSGGRVVVVDFFKKPLPVGPPPEMKIAREEMVKEFIQAGFRKSGEYDFLPYQYFLVFEP